MQGVKDHPCAEDIIKVMSANGLQERVGGVNQEQANSPRGTVLMELPQGPRCRTVRTSDGARVQEQPSNGRSRLIDKRADLLRKVTGIGVKQVGSELKNNQTGFSDRARDCRVMPPCPAAVACQHGRMRPIAVAN